MLFNIFAWASAICLVIVCLFIFAFIVCIGVDACFHEGWNNPKRWDDKFYEFLDNIPHFGRYVAIFFVVFIVVFVGAALTEPKESNTEEYRITEQNDEYIVLKKEGCDKIYVINLNSEDE